MSLDKVDKNCFFMEHCSSVSGKGTYRNGNPSRLSFQLWLVCTYIGNDLTTLTVKSFVTLHRKHYHILCH